MSVPVYRKDGGTGITTGALPGPITFTPALKPMVPITSDLAGYVDFWRPIAYAAVGLLLVQTVLLFAIWQSVRR